MESIGVSLIIGNNGYIWISPYIPKPEEDDTELNLNPPNEQPREIPPVSLETRQNMTRIRNAIVILSRKWVAIHPSTIKYVFNMSVKLEMQPKDMLLPQHVDLLTENATLSLTDQI